MAHEHTQHTRTDDLKAGGRDLSRVAMLVAGLSFLLLVIFFFTISGKLTDMSTRVEALVQGQERITAMETRLGGFEMRMDELAMLPEQARRQAYSDTLAEMDGRLDSLAGQVGDQRQAQALQRVRQLLAETRQGLQQQ